MKSRTLLFIIIVCILTGTFSFAQQNGTPDLVRVAVLKNFPPQYSISEAGQPQGFAIDIIEAVAKLSKFKIVYLVKDSWQKMFDAVKNGEADLIPNMGITGRRETWFAFSKPVETFPVSIFVRENEDTVSNMQSLNGKTVAVVELNFGEVLVENYPDVIVQKYIHAQDALFNLLSGDSTALIFSEPVLWKIARNARIDDRIKVVGEPLIEIHRAISVNKNNRSLLKTIDLAVTELVKSKEYQKIYTQWYGSPRPFWTVNRVVGIMAGLLIASVSGMGIWRYRSTIKLNKLLNENIKKRELAEQELQDAYATLEEKVEERTKELQEVLSEVKILSGLLPICSHCKKIRDDQGYWNSIESYIHEHSEAEFSHGICQDCLKKHYPDYDSDDDEPKKD